MESAKEQFKNYLRKVGSGEHTSRGMSREESAHALSLMLTAEVTPAQIGAFMIAHRIRRPEPQELAGMLDTYRTLGPKIQSQKGQLRPICFGMPFDGRRRTEPIYPLTTLILLSVGQPVVLQGGKRMPTKYGITTTELFSSLGLNLTGLSLKQLQNGFIQNNFAAMHQPDHFPMAEKLISYREELGKRPPIASMELIWTAHQGKHLLISGFVHPPTEERALETLQLMQETEVIFVKGVEGGTDLPLSKNCIIGRVENTKLERIIINPTHYKLYSKEIKWENIDRWKFNALNLLDNKGELKQAVLWNAGVYLWLGGITKTLESGIEQAEHYVASGLVKKTLEKLIAWRSALGL